MMTLALADPRASRDGFRTTSPQGDTMNESSKPSPTARFIAASAFAALLAGPALPAAAQALNVPLSGAQEIPPVTTSATGTGTVTVKADRSLAASASVSGMAVLMAHIHEAPAGANGPVIIPLVKQADGSWAAPPNTTLTEAQYASFKAGNLYFNFHSDAHKSGEIRGQIKP